MEYSDVFDIKRDAGAALKKIDSFGWVVTFCAMFIEERGIYIDSGLFKDNAEYMRDALVAASAVFHDLGDRR